MNMIETTEFRTELEKRIREAVAMHRKDGCTRMSLDNLMQTTRPAPAFLAGAPRGTNAQYYYREMFRQVARETVHGFLSE